MPQLGVVRSCAILDFILSLQNVCREWRTARSNQYLLFDKEGKSSCQINLHRKRPNSKLSIHSQETEEMADLCTRLGYKAAPYHAGLPEKQRKTTQDQFKCDVIE